MDFYAVLDQVLDLLRQRGRVTYNALKRQFGLDEACLQDLKDEIIAAQRVAVDEGGTVLVWTGDVAASPPPAAALVSDRVRQLDTAPLTYTPPHLAEQILTSRAALEGERKQVTVLFADLKGSMELLAERDPEEARHLLDPVLDRMMAAVHQYEGTVNQVMGDGIMALFGAPLAHEDHAVRACYAALRMQEAVKQYAAEVQRTHGVPLGWDRSRSLCQTISARWAPMTRPSPPASAPSPLRRQAGTSSCRRRRTSPSALP